MFLGSVRSRQLTISGVLVVRSNSIRPDPRVEKTAVSLKRSQYRVTVLGWDRTGLLPQTEAREFGNLELISIRAGHGRGLRNLAQVLRWSLALQIFLVRRRKEFEIIHACDFDTILPALLAKRLLGKRVIYDIFDYYADHLRATPWIIRRLISYVDRWAISKADAVILSDDARLHQIRDTHPRRLIVVINSPEDRLEELEGKNLSSSSLGERSDMETDTAQRSTIPHKRTYRNAQDLRIAFVGLLYAERGLLELLEVLLNKPRWSLELAGFGGDEPIIASKARTLPNVHIHGRISYQRALRLMHSSDILIATYDPNIPNHRYASPNKLFEAMMLAKPIVVAEGTNMDRIVEEHGCGLVVPYGDVPTLEAALAQLADDPELRERLGQAGRRAYETNYNWSIMQERLQDLYNQI